MIARIDWGNASVPLTALRDDQRARGRGVPRGDHQEGLEGTGAVPIGWSDCAWDYEQGQGYVRYTLGNQYEYNDFMLRDDAVAQQRWPLMDHRWSYDEVGVYPPDYSDEQEDELTGVAPPRRVDHRGCWDWEPDAWIDRVRAEQGLEPLPVPEKDDTLAKAFEEDQRAHEAAVAQQAAEEQAAAHVRAIRRNVTAMRNAARAKIKEHIANGVPGKYAVEVRKENQTYRIDYEIRADGKAYISKKKAGWVPAHMRR